MKKIKLIRMIILTLGFISLTNAAGDKAGSYDALKGPAVASTSSVVGGTVMWKLYVSSASANVLGVTILLSSSLALGYGAGMIIRAVDNIVGDYIGKVAYWIGEETHLFNGILSLDDALESNL